MLKPPVTLCWKEKDFGHSKFCEQCKYAVECAERAGVNLKVRQNMHKHKGLKEMIKELQTRRSGVRVSEIVTPDVEIRKMPKVDKNKVDRMDYINK